MAYDYKENVKNDCIDAIREYIKYHADDVKGMSRDDLREKLYDALWIDDSVTGNASGSYTFSSYDAEQNIAGNWDLLGEAMREFGCECVAIDNDAGAYIQDGEVLDVDGVAPFCMRFDSEYFSKIFKRFKVLGVEFVAPTNRDGTNGTARFSVMFKGSMFTVVLLQCGAGEVNEYAEDLVKDWDLHDKGQDRKGQEAA